MTVPNSYLKIVSAVKSGKLKEPFFPFEVVKACKIKNVESFRKIPSRYRKGNPYGNKTLFIRLKDGSYKLTRPFKT
ncbi:MAG: hypothetical protein OEL69_02200 [Nitrosopumilus sp.]|nr:hypothetical protein [Nitrosopumilus sp.]